MGKKKVLVTGASGLIGGLIVKNLADKYDLTALNRRAVDGIPTLQADVADMEAITPAFEGVETVVHLSAYTEDIFEWEGIQRVNIGGTYNVYEASRTSGVKRVVFASTGGIMLGHEIDSPYGEITAAEYDKVPETWPMVTHEWPARPDNVFYVSKLFGEALGRYYSDYHGISALNIRLGGVFPDDKPELRRHLPGYLSHADCVQMVEKCIDAPDDLMYGTFDAISDNKWRWRDTDHAKEVLGWNPTGSAEDYEIADKGGRHQLGLG